MKILVCISNVPDTTTKINFSDDQKSFNATGVQFIINPYDEIALTRALELTETSAGSVTVINVGDASTEPTIRKALAIGATDAVRINALPRDAYYVAKQISELSDSDLAQCYAACYDEAGCETSRHFLPPSAVHGFLLDDLQLRKQEVCPVHWRLQVDPRQVASCYLCCQGRHEAPPHL